jgi:hypothetical protein
MTTMVNTAETKLYTVIHPLDDAPEQKRSLEAIGPIKMSRSVRLSLMALRAYLVLMTAMTAVRVVEIASTLGHHAVH